MKKEKANIIIDNKVVATCEEFKLKSKRKFKLKDILWNLEGIVVDFYIDFMYWLNHLHFHKWKILESRLNECGWFDVTKKCKICDKIKKEIKL